MSIVTDVAVFDGNDLLPGRYDVRIVGRTIAEIQPTGSSERSADTVNASGATLLPGLIDGHVHLSKAADFDALLSGGVTSAADMGTWPPERLEALRAQSGWLAFLSPGAPLIGPSGPHSHMPGLADSVISTPAIAREVVSERAAQGVDYIKLVLEAGGRGGPGPDAVLAAVEAAHASGLRVVAHASAVGAIELAVEVGVDILTHAPLDGSVSAETIGRIVQNGIIVVPTLIMMRTTAERREILPAYEFAKSFVTALHDVGARLVAGSDANSSPGAPAAVDHRTGVRDELALLVDAGLSPVDALRTATVTAAEVFGFPDRGVIRPGSIADLMLVDGSPAERITDLASVREVWLGGSPIGARS